MISVQMFCVCYWKRIKYSEFGNIKNIANSMVLIFSHCNVASFQLLVIDDVPNVTSTQKLLCSFRFILTASRGIYGMQYFIYDI